MNKKNQVSRRVFQFAFTLISLVPSLSAFATLDTGVVRGEQQVQIAAPGAKPEICVIPQHLKPQVYSANDLQKEKALCSLNESTNVAVCPKTNSTNPGVDWYNLAAGQTAAQAEANHCKAPDHKTGLSMVAKYKLSTSCSYTPSIIGYYHVARMLGGVARVPVAVLRTMDLSRHLGLASEALAETNPNDIIHQTWQGLQQQLAAGGQAPRRDLLLTSDFRQSYGALLANPSNELFYKEFFNGGADNVERTANFRDQNPIYATVASSASVSALVGHGFTAANVQKLVQMKDASDMIVIDTLMSQQDRMGNIHYQESYLYLDQAHREGDGSPTLASEDQMTASQVNAAHAVQVKVMVLKDNDCGVSKTNISKSAGLADRIAHLDPKTYRSLLQLNKAADSATMMNEFYKEFLFTSHDYAVFRQNLKDLAAQFESACHAGRLKLDLDVHGYFASSMGVVPAVSCDL